MGNSLFIFLKVFKGYASKELARSLGIGVACGNFGTATRFTRKPGIKNARSYKKLLTKGIGW